MIETKENTAEYILRKVSPIFNKKGYVATSLSDLEDATGMTKGAIYRNFKSKEDLAIKAFKRNVKLVINPLSELLKKTDSAIQKLFIITVYYRRYYDNALLVGGCPVLNIGVDAHYTNPELFNLSRTVAQRLEDGISDIIKLGIKQGEIKSDLDVKAYSERIFSMIEGGAFMSFLKNSKSYMDNTMDQLESMIKNDMIR